MNASHNHGSALLLALWAIALIALVLIGVVAMVQGNQKESGALNQNFQARRIAENGITLALNPIVQEGDPVLKGQSPLGGDYEVRLISEGARLNINTLLKDDVSVALLRRLLRSWGLDDVQVSTAVDSLLDWVDGDSFTRLNGAEKDFYRASNRSDNYPANQPFESIEEMSLVHGMDAIAAKKPRWRDYFTIWGEGHLDLNDASPELIEIVCEVGNAQADMLVQAREQMRNNTDPKLQRWRDVSVPLTLLGIPQEKQLELGQWVNVSTDIWRINSTAHVGKRRYTVGVVTRRGDAKPEILQRYEK